MDNPYRNSDLQAFVTYHGALPNVYNTTVDGSSSLYTGAAPLRNGILDISHGEYVTRPKGTTVDTVSVKSRARHGGNAHNIEAVNRAAHDPRSQKEYRVHYGGGVLDGWDLEHVPNEVHDLGQPVLLSRYVG